VEDSFTAWARYGSALRFARLLPLSPLPSGTFTALGIKAFNRFRRLTARLPNPPDFLSLPATVLFLVLAADHRSWFPVSRILFPPASRGSAVISLTPSFARLRGLRRAHSPWSTSAERRIHGSCDIPETIGRAAQSPILSCTRRGFSCRPPRGEARWALTPPFHPYLAGCPAGRYILCDTIRHHGLNRGACACLAARAASCPMVSGLSSPSFNGRGS